MVRLTRSGYLFMCRQLGVPVADAMRAVVGVSGDWLEIDESHPDYPRNRRRRPAPAGGQAHEHPSPLEKAKNFASSAARHVAAGMPRCTQEQIDARYAICQQCEHFQNGACAKCGCPLVRERQYISKLSWANEECPVGKWGQVTHPAA